MRRLAGSVIVFLSLITSASITSAQAAGDLAVYRAVTQTQLGALPAVLDFAITAERPGAPSLYLGYGIRTYRDRPAHAFGLGTSIALRPAMALGLNAGYWSPECEEGCHGHPMLKASLAQGMITQPLGDGIRSNLTVGLRMETAAALPRGEMLWSARTVLPIALVPSENGAPRFIPWVGPGVAIGLERGDDGTNSGILATLSGGLGLVGVAGLRMSVGVERAYVSGGGNWMVGASVGTGR